MLHIQELRGKNKKKKQSTVATCIELQYQALCLHVSTTHAFTKIQTTQAVYFV